MMDNFTELIRRAVWHASITRKEKARMDLLSDNTERKEEQRQAPKTHPVARR